MNYTNDDMIFQAKCQIEHLESFCEEGFTPVSCDGDEIILLDDDGVQASIYLEPILYLIDSLEALPKPEASSDSKANRASSPPKTAAEKPTYDQVLMLLDACVEAVVEMARREARTPAKGGLKCITWQQRLQTIQRTLDAAGFDA